MLHLYAITERPELPGRTGLRGAALRAIGEHDLYAVVSEVAEEPLEADVDDLWAHEDVVEALMEIGPVLPARFGSILEDELAAGALVRRRRVEFKRALARVRGRVELGVRALAPAREEPVAEAGESRGPGTAYMLGLLERERRDTDAVALIHEPLAAIAHESARGPGPARTAGRSVAYLVDRDRVDAFRARVEELAEANHAAVVCTGPWPPYSFTTGAAE